MPLYKWRETLSKVLTSFQTNYLTNLDVTKDRVISQKSERIEFYCNHDEAAAYIKFLYGNIRVNNIR